MFMQSAKKLEAYLRDAQTLVHHISQSEIFAKISCLLLNNQKQTQLQ